MNNKIIFIDHYDSFADTIIYYLKELNQQVKCYKSNNIKDIIKNLKLVSKVIIGPGSGHPKNLVSLYKIITLCIKFDIPILGICLGHQILAQYFKAKIITSSKIQHGYNIKIIHNNHFLYSNIKKISTVTLYNSLVVDIKKLPNNIIPISYSNYINKELMGFSHINYKIYGIQYHPEAYLTNHGKQFLKNFLY